MNSRVTLGLAGLFLVGAIIAGYWGLSLSRPPVTEPVAAPVAAPVVAPAVQTEPVEDPTRQPVVVLLRDIAPFVKITAADVAVEKLRTAPAGSLGKIEQVVGRTPWRPLSAGSWLNDESFEPGSQLARMIRPGERALAVAVDEVITAGGQLAPGDYVDVLLFLRRDESNPQASAQLVVPAVRVLGVGSQMGLTNDGQPAGPARSDDERLKQEQQRMAARSVVLAVPETLLSRLMLASGAGVLRLAVRSADEQQLSKYWSGENDAATRLDTPRRELLEFNQLSLAAPPRPMAVAGQPAARKPAVEVIRGVENAQPTP
ncbi:Flp pilus assembly protein CpaB [Pseudomonas fluorescens]|jgi:pilus assembly protein CpaB|uniref:Flp pilus assembly protein CpaB n=1 Tax=Pseudomonas TaxID=286 RepID=UPI0009868B57|nr:MULTISPECIES: Flp pilus assembly protein CpaB [Pseudomonas]OOH83017.1 Flp pilus assembly protein CpaB [Pseudomonas koreensis]QUE93692.1 Flp pilus assembly protein CpaB [Pseudomonas sp. SCA2728.1_7]